MFNKINKIGLTILAVTAVLGCNKQNSFTSSSDSLTIVAGSEIKTLEPILKEAQDKLGINIDIQYSGTIDGVEKVKSNPKAYDIAWFGNSKYFYDTAETSKLIKLSEKMFLSPVIVGVKESSYKKHNFQPQLTYTWKDIAGWVKDKNMTYAMTDPSVSNSGYVALMGVVYSTANKGENVKMSDINTVVLQDFFKGQKITAKSSNWIMDNFNKDSSIDFVVNYESAILSNTAGEKLIPVYPSEGIVTSDYPMLLLDDSKKEIYKKLIAYLKSPEIQTRLVNEYKYRSILPEVMAKQKVFNSDQLLIEMPFNPEQALADSILTAYFNSYKKPAKFAFVLDTSGSMRGDRELQLKDAMSKLVTGQLSRYSALRTREEAIIIPFSNEPYDLKIFNSNQTKQLTDYVNGLTMDGGTKMFSSVASAIEVLKEDQKKNGDKFRYSVIVLTDGQSNAGFNSDEFIQWYQQQHFKQGEFRVFAISFGDADMNQLTALSNATGGSVFDGQTNLSSAFKEIRSYQ
jgi:Ca-activated chloride channel homolog